MTTNTEWPRPRWRRRRSLRSFRSFRRLEMLTLLLLRIVLLEAPLLLSLALLLTTHALELYIHQVVEPDLQARQSSKRFRDGSTCLETTGYRNTMQTPTVYPTTASGPALCPQQLPELISRSKADLLRGYILGSLSMDEDIAISHRTNVVGEQSWTLVVDEHPAVSLFLEELFNNPFLDALLKQLLGDDAAVVGFRVSVSPSTKSLEQESVPKLACEESGRITAATLTIPLHDSNVVTSSGELSPAVPIWPTSSGHLCIHSQPSARSLPYMDFGGRKNLKPIVQIVLGFTPRPQRCISGFKTSLPPILNTSHLHWTQWGHTVSDWRQPCQHMAQPWRTLKSLGWYKSPLSQWGWDYVTVASESIANNEFGWTNADFDTFVQNSGLHTLSSSLQSELRMDADVSNIWLRYIVDAMLLCRSTLSQAHHVLLLSYTFLLSVELFRYFYTRSTAKHHCLADEMGRPAWYSIRRVVFWYAATCTVYSLMVQSISHSLLNH